MHVDPHLMKHTKKVATNMVQYITPTINVHKSRKKPAWIRRHLFDNLAHK